MSDVRTLWCLTPPGVDALTSALAVYLDGEREDGQPNVVLALLVFRSPEAALAHRREALSYLDYLEKRLHGRVPDAMYRAALTACSEPRAVRVELLSLEAAP